MIRKILMAKPILTSEEQSTIASAVGDAEKTTSGEIVPAVIRESSDYAVYELLFAFAAGFLFYSILLVFYPSVSGMIDRLFWFPPDWYVTAFYGVSTVLLIGLAYFFSNMPVLDRLIIPRKVREEAVRKRAMLYFTEAGLTETRDRTGILIFVSLMERRVEVLADKGISEKIPQSEWDSLAGALARDIGKGELSPGLCRAVDSCGKKLTQHFPIKSDDTNELPDGVDLPEK